MRPRSSRRRPDAPAGRASRRASRRRPAVPYRCCDRRPRSARAPDSDPGTSPPAAAPRRHPRLRARCGAGLAHARPLPAHSPDRAAGSDRSCDCPPGAAPPPARRPSVPAVPSGARASASPNRSRSSACRRSGARRWRSPPTGGSQWWVAQRKAPPAIRRAIAERRVSVACRHLRGPSCRRSVRSTKSLHQAPARANQIAT